MNYASYYDSSSLIEQFRCRTTKPGIRKYDPNPRKKYVQLKNRYKDKDRNTLIVNAFECKPMRLFRIAEDNRPNTLLEQTAVLYNGTYPLYIKRRFKSKSLRDKTN